MKYIVFFILLSVLFQENIHSQNNMELFMPLEFQQAYAMGTRAEDGNPGENYWQNSASYNIEAQINPETKILTGTADITYQNNSPDTLRIIVVRLYHDLYKEGNARDRAISTADITSGIELEEVKISGEDIELENRFVANHRGTNLFMRLPDLLYPGSSVDLSISWSTEIPSETLIRMGAVDESTMFVAYWYPQISVYDDIEGWDYYDYRGNQEFYQDLADFNVKLNVPNGFLVWATGKLENAENTYSDKILTNLEKAKTSDETIQISEKPKKAIKAKGDWITWEYTATEVPDFAFALSDHYVWDASSVLLDSTSNERILVNTIYNQESEKRFEHVTEYQRQSLIYFSHNFPGVMYPYHKFTTFQGLHGGGMEFPMMANNGDYTQGDDTLDLTLTAEVTAHEIAHTYMPFYILVNERKYTWMEEGWATLLGERATTYIQEQTGLSDRYVVGNMYENRFYRTEGTQFSVPLMTPSIIVKNRTTHFHLSYYKAFYAYKTLENILGKEIFEKALQEYFERWKWKHPTPYDFFYTFNDVSDRNLNWFWKSWFFEFGYPDVAIKDISEGSVTVANEGLLPIPFELRITYQDNSMNIIKKDAGVWENNNEISVSLEDTKNIRHVQLVNYIVPDVYPDNNVMD